MSDRRWEFLAILFLIPAIIMTLLFSAHRISASHVYAHDGEIMLSRRRGVWARQLWVHDSAVSLLSKMQLWAVDTHAHTRTCLTHVMLYNILAHTYRLTSTQACIVLPSCAGSPHGANARSRSGSIHVESRMLTQRLLLSFRYLR